ncbi:MAG: tetratricopeptide repeat protein [Lysobacteraceae bacterium]
MNRRVWRDCALPIVLTALLAGTPMAMAAPASAPGGALLRALLAGEFARQGGDAPAAAAWRLEAARLAEDPGLAALAVSAAIDADDADRAAAALARWTEIEPSSPVRDTLALRFHLVQGDLDPAVDTARRVLARAEGGRQVAAALARPYPDDGVMARAALRALLLPPPEANRIEEWLALAGAAQRLGDDVLAGQWIDALVARFPDDPRAGLLRAERLGQAGRRDAARTEVRRVLGRSDLTAEQRRIAAEALALLGDPAGAAQALSRGPQDAQTFGSRAAWLARAGRLDSLRTLLLEVEAAALAAPEAPALSLLAGEVAERVQAWPDAERWYRRVDRGEAGQRARLRLGVVLGRQGRVDEAQAVWSALQADEAADGALRRDAFLAESDLRESRGDRAGAAAVLARCLAVLEDDPGLRVARARLSRAAGRIGEAEAELRDILARDPRHAPALRALGALLLGERRPRDAEAVLARAWAEEPGAPTAAAWGEALWLAGDRDAALRAWQRGRDLDPTDPVLADTVRRYGR